MPSQDDNVRVPVYLITGFLESGKTTFIRNTARQEYFQIPQKTLVISTEEGLEAYDDAELLKSRTVSALIESKEELTKETLQGFEDTMHPGRVMLEYNPLWGMADIENLEMPDGWGIIQEIALVDSSTYEVYRNNMKSMFVDMFRNADMVIFNRAKEEMPLSDYRRSIKVVSPACEVVFEDTNGQMLDIFSDKMPYDLDADVIEVEDADFGIFFVDLRDNPDRYDGRIVRFRGKIKKSRAMPSKYFGIGWMAMTCCADDIQFIGYLAESPEARRFSSDTWVTVEAKVEMRHMLAYRGVGPVFTVWTIAPTEAPASELVYFS